MIMMMMMMINLNKAKFDVRLRTQQHFYFAPEPRWGIFAPRLAAAAVTLKYSGAYQYERIQTKISDPGYAR